MKLEKRKKDWGKDETKCPVCSLWYRNLVAHRKRVKDEKHKKFYLENSEEVIVKRRKFNL